MSFDIFFQPCRFTPSSVEKKNPFTGKVQSTLDNEPLCSAELMAVQRVLNQACAEGPDKCNCYVVSFEDGGGAEVFAKNLEQGCMVALRGVTNDLLQFLFELLDAGKWVMWPTMEDTASITTSPDSIFGIPDDFPRVVVCKSAEEIGTLLSGGFQSWKKYRDQIVDSE